MTDKTALETFFDTVNPSPVQGAASAPDRLQALGRRTNKEAGLNPFATSSASGAQFGQGGAIPDNSGPVNHAEAYELACAKRDESNLARCYLDLRAALADRSPAVQPSGTVQALVVGVTPGMGRIEIEFGGDVPEWADLGLRIRIATPAPEQEAAQVAPPGAQEAVAIVRDTQKDGVYAEILSEEIANALPEGTLLYTAPVPATTPAEQPEGDSSHVMRPFGATAGQQESTPLDLLAVADAERKRIAEVYEQAIKDETCEVGGHVNRQWAHLEGAVFVVKALRRATATNTNQPEGEKGGAA